MSGGRSVGRACHPRRVTATADDYLWFFDRFPALGEAYCLTLVSGLGPGDVVERLGATSDELVARCAEWLDDVPHGMSLDDLGEAAMAGPGEYGMWDGHFFGAAALGDWCLIVEPNDSMGVDAAIAGPLSEGRRLVSHFRNVNAVKRFHWMEDGELRLRFEPPFAATRHGADPDGAVEAMRLAGFDLEGEPGCFTVDDVRRHTGAVFALAENLTGVRLTPELLAGSAYLGAVAPRP